MTQTLPLARKLRPTSFADLHGHEQIKQAILSTLSPLKHHAFLLVGSRGLGKTTIGRLIAQRVLCEQPTDKDSCTQCSACVRIQKNEHPDVLEIDAASHSKVEQTREIISQCSLAPLHGRYKVYLIDEVHMLSSHSFNALLKTLEEPPEHVVFILATTHEEKIPSTVRSRCLKFFLQKPTLEALKAYLKDFCEKKQIAFDEQILGILAQQASGSYRDLLNVLEYSLALSGSEQLKNKELLKIFSYLSEDQFSAVVNALRQAQTQVLYQLLDDILSKQQFCPKNFMRQFLSYLSASKNFHAATPGLYTELSKVLPVLESHPDPKNFVLMSVLRIALLIAKKKAQKSLKVEAVST